jgi:hypothetical protein
LKDSIRPSALARLDPQHTGVVNGIDLLALFNEQEQGTSPVVYLDKSSYEQCVNNVSPVRKVILPLLDLAVEHKGANTAKRAVLKALMDSGVSSCVADETSSLRTILGDQFDVLLDKTQHLPRFSVADDNVVTPIGVMPLSFRFKGMLVHWNFYVLSQCAHPLIVGNDFMASHYWYQLS